MNWKELGTGVLLLALLGIAGFLYRNASERPAAPGTACTLEAKLCPDGTAVGRSGPNCALAPCPPPNVSLDYARIAFALPAGYVEDDSAALPDPYGVNQYVEQSSGTSTPATITIFDIPISSGESAGNVILANTQLSPSGLPPASMQVFRNETIGNRNLPGAGHTFSVITIERFEGRVQTAYFLTRAADVLRFDAVDTGVTDWTNPALDISALPAQKVLRTLLGTLESAP